MNFFLKEVLTLLFKCLLRGLYTLPWYCYTISLQSLSLNQHLLSPISITLFQLFRYTYIFFSLFLSFLNQYSTKIFNHFSSVFLSFYLLFTSYTQPHTSIYPYICMCKCVFFCGNNGWHECLFVFGLSSSSSFCCCYCFLYNKNSFFFHFICCYYCCSLQQCLAISYNDKPFKPN